MNKTKLILLALIVLFSACSNNVPILDASQSNIGSAAFLGMRYNPIMETDEGYYFNLNTLENLSMRYIDKETDTEIYLCAKPECNHDGSSFCTATNSEINPVYMAMYGDFIYIAGSRLQNERLYFSLYCLNKDGSELTRIADYLDIPNDINIGFANGGLTIHKGKAIVTYNLCYDLSRLFEGISGISIIDLNNLKVETIEEVDKSEIGTHANVKAFGDYIYYMLGNELGKSNLLKRYNINNKTTEELPVNGLFRSYAVVGDEVYFNYLRNTIKKYNTVTAETTDFEWDTVIDGEEIRASEIMYDGEYLYVCRTGVLTGLQQYSSGNSDDADDIRIYIYNLEGNLLSAFTHESEIYNTDNGVARKTYHGYSFHILGGKVYYQNNKIVEFCKIEDILNGNVSWTRAYVFEE